MSSFNNLSEDLCKVLFDQAVRSQSPDQLSTRDVGRYFEISSLLFTSKRHNDLFFNNIKKLHIDGIENSSFRSWKQVISFIRRCGHNLQSLTLEYIRFDNNDPTSNSSADDDVDAMDIEDPNVLEEAEEWNRFSLPNLKSLKIVSCSEEESIRIIKAVSQHNLQSLHLDLYGLNIPLQSYANDFLSKELLKFLQTNHPGLRELKLAGIPLARESVRAPLNELLGNLESLSLTHLKFDEAVDAIDLLSKLKEECKKLSSLSLRVAHVSFEAIKELCISQKMTLQKLRLSQQPSSGDISDWEVYNIIDDCTALICLEIGGIEYIDINLLPTVGPLTSKWVEYAAIKLGAQLETLGMSYTRIDKESLTIIATECRTIKSLCFKSCSIEGDCTEEFFELVDSVQLTLEELEIQEACWLTDQHLETLHDRLRHSSFRALRLGRILLPLTGDVVLNIIKKFGSSLEEIEVYECFYEEETPGVVLDAVVKHCNPQKLKWLLVLSPTENAQELIGGKLAQVGKLLDQVVIEVLPEDSYPRKKTFL